MGGVGWGGVGWVVLLITLSLPTWVEVELGCDNLSCGKYMQQYTNVYLLFNFADGKSGYFPVLWQYSVYRFLFLTSLWRIKWKWFFPMLFKIFLNLPNQQKVCSAIMRFASGQSCLTFSGAYKVLHSGRWKTLEHFIEYRAWVDPLYGSLYVVDQ